MIKREFRCMNCGEKFVIEVLEPGEAEERRIHPVPVTCPNCRSSNVKRI